MTWSANISGHHSSSEWRKEEYELLRSFIEAVEKDSTTVTSTFNFNGNNVFAANLAQAKEKLAEYDAE